MSHKGSVKVDGRPSMQFYVDDWLEDCALKLVSLSAQGLWIHLLCRMWKSPERGVLLKANGSKAEAKDIAKWIGIPEAEAKQTLSELKAENVCETLADGTIYSRRMVRDEKQRQSKQEAGAKGGKVSKPGSRTLSKTKAKRGPSSSTSSSTSSPPPYVPPSRGDGGGGKEGAKEEDLVLRDELLLELPTAVVEWAIGEFSEDRIRSAWSATLEAQNAGKIRTTVAAYFKWALDEQIAEPKVEKKKRTCPSCHFGTRDDGSDCTDCKNGIIYVTDEEYSNIKKGRK